MTDPVAVKWTDGMGRVRWGVEDTKGRRLVCGYGGFHYFCHADVDTDPDVRYRIKQQALRAGRRHLRREARRRWTEDV